MGLYPTVGSNPTLSANFPQQIDGSSKPDTDSAQKAAESGQRKVEFPQVIRHRKVEATIYGKSRHYQRYRLAFYVVGQRRLRTFANYSEAKAEAERIVREVANDSQVTALTGSQAGDALAAIQRLDSFRQATGKRVSLLAAVSEFAEAAAKLEVLTIGDAFDRYLSTVANVKRKDLREAVEPRTRASEGQRAQPSPQYADNCGTGESGRFY